MTKIELANEFIEQNSQSVITDYRNKYHLSAPIGWLNDPNGFIYYKGEYHLFYQYYPYDSVWGPMYWGHAKTKDLIDWEHLPVALAPDEAYDSGGCFSGSAIEKDGILYLMYTGHTEIAGKRKEVQCIAYSNDGIQFEKYAANPVIGEMEIEGYAGVEDFRDPKVFRQNGRYYSVIASKTADERGQILLFESQDLFNWNFVAVLLEGTKEQGIMWECPDLFELDGKDVLIISPIQIQKRDFEFANVSSTLAVIGKMDWKAGLLSVEHTHEIDFGMDFYAPQTCLDDKNRRIMVAWMQMWGRTMPTNVLGNKWAGSMTLPRELSVKNGRLVQKPISFVYENMKQINKMEYSSVQGEPFVLENICSDTSYFMMELDLSEGKSVKVEFAKGDADGLVIEYDVTTQVLTFDRGQCGYQIVGEEKEILTKRSAKVALIKDKLHMEIFRDTSSIELFINEQITMSNTFYEKDRGRDLVITAEGKIVIKVLVVNEIIV